MRLDLFSKGDVVLLLGEGNFSFSVCLHRHKLPIKIIATCFETDAEFEHRKENIDYLTFNKVPVFLNVDATKLSENEYFSNVKFSKIIFNFPHVGGKMKIHLNRALLRKVFENCSALLRDDGLMIVSLCRGQGGTPVDRPQRPWNDSWQVTEMAAHGDFILTAVEPFLRDNFTEYRCIGYRGQDTQFHLNGALVHIFAKGKPPYDTPGARVPINRLNLVALRPGSKIFVPIIYSEIYRNNPMENANSPISFLRQLILRDLNQNSVNSEWKILNDDDIPFHVENGTGVLCHVNDIEYPLRATPFDILPELLAVDNPAQENWKRIIFLGTYFSRLGTDFSSAPVQIDFTLTGKNLLAGVQRFLKNLINLFEAKDVVFVQNNGENVSEERSYYSVTSLVELILEDRRTLSRVKAAIFCDLQYRGINTEVCVVHSQAICQYFFKIGWREIWAEKTKVLHTQKPTFKLSSLYSVEYKFDITLRYTEVYSEERFCELLWLGAGELIQGVELVSDYASGKGWCSKCYRITYKSLDKPLFRNRIIDIHSKIVAEVLKLGLNVAIG